MPPSGESLKIFARDLGHRVYTKYAIQLKQQSKMVEKLGNIYNAYVGLQAKDSEVTRATRCSNSLATRWSCTIAAQMFSLSSHCTSL